MDADRRVSVAEWQPNGAPQLPPRIRRQSRYRISARFLGVLGTILVHVAVLQSLVVLGTQPKKIHRPINTGPGSTAIAGDRMTDQPLVLLQPIAAPESAISPLGELASRGIASRDLQIALISPDPAPPAVDIPPDAKDDPTADSDITSGDPAGRARLFGIYTRQIQARIDRIWRRPRTPISQETDPKETEHETFHCQIQVVQDAHGNVEEIMLPNCNGSTDWQQSLVSAVRESSPLPAPPDQKVFSKSITLQFVGFAYRAGDSPGTYKLYRSQPLQAARHQ